jgi:uncharacterized protein (DUF697 family)
MARFCSKCNIAASNNATFCNKCGERLPQSPAETPDHSPVNPYKAEVAGVEYPRRPAGGDSFGGADSRDEGTSFAAVPSGRTPRVTAGEGKDEVSQAETDTLDRARQIVRNYSLWSAAIWLVPVPFIHIIVLIPVLTSMIVSLANLFTLTVSPRRLLVYFAASTGATALGHLTFWIVMASIFGWSMPMITWIVGAPFIYGWTYGLGEMAILYMQSNGRASRKEMREAFREGSSRAQKMYPEEKKVSKDEALQALRNHLAPEDYDRLKNAASTGVLPDLDLDFSQPAVVVLSKAAALLKQAGVLEELAATSPAPSGDVTIPILCNVDGRRWAVYIETQPWDLDGLGRLTAWLARLRTSADKDLLVRVFSPSPVPSELESLLHP